MSIKFKFKIPEEAEIIFNEEAKKLLTDLHNKFDGKISELLTQREQNQENFNAGKAPDFLNETKEIRDSEWKVREIPEDLLDRRVEITGPVDRKMIINALNADVKVFMADFEDSLSLLGRTLRWAKEICMTLSEEPLHLKIQPTIKSMN